MWFLSRKPATQAFDSFLATGADDAARALMTSTSRGAVLFSVERECYPDKSLASDFPEPSRGACAAAGGRYRYLNAGGYGGRASDVRSLLKAAWAEAVRSGEGTSADDQLLFQRRLLAQHAAGALARGDSDAHADADAGARDDSSVPSIVLDYACTIFQANAGEDVNAATGEHVLQVEITASGGVELVNTLTGARPALVHYNGGPRMRMGALRLLQEMPFWPPRPEPEPRADITRLAQADAAAALVGKGVAYNECKMGVGKIRMAMSEGAGASAMDDVDHTDDEDFIVEAEPSAADESTARAQPQPHARAHHRQQHRHQQRQQTASSAAGSDPHSVSEPSEAPDAPASEPASIAEAAEEGVPHDDEATRILAAAAAAADADGEGGSWLFPATGAPMPLAGCGSVVPGFDASAEGKAADAPTEALLMSARMDDVKGIMTALEEGAEVDFEFGTKYGAPEGYTALMSACARGRRAAARALLQAGADPNFVNTWGELVVFWAIDGGEKMVELLVEFGCDLDDISPRGWTALSYAEACGSYSRVYADVPGGPLGVVMRLGATRVGLGPPTFVAASEHPDEYLQVAIEGQ